MAPTRIAADAGVAHPTDWLSVVGIDKDYGQQPRRALALAMFTHDLLTRLAHGPQGFKLGVAIRAEVFAEG